MLNLTVHRTAAAESDCVSQRHWAAAAGDLDVRRPGEISLRARELSYRCAVCGWRGQLEPVDAGDAAPCPRCGVFLYPASWARTWGVALLLMAATVGAVAAVAALL